MSTSAKQPTKQSNSKSFPSKLENYLLIYLQEAFDALNVTLQWLESQGSDPNHLLLVKKKNWRDTAARMRQETLKQTKLTKY